MTDRDAALVEDGLMKVAAAAAFLSLPGPPSTRSWTGASFPSSRSVVVAVFPSAPLLNWPPADYAVESDSRGSRLRTLAAKLHCPGTQIGCTLAVQQPIRQITTKTPPT